MESKEFKLEKIKQKLQEAVRNSDFETIGFFELAQTIGTTLSPEEFSVLHEFEETEGEEAANAWMVKILVETGRLRDEGDGYIGSV